MDTVFAAAAKAAKKLADMVPPTKRTPKRDFFSYYETCGYKIGWIPLIKKSGQFANKHTKSAHWENIPAVKAVLFIESRLFYANIRGNDIVVERYEDGCSWNRTLSLPTRTMIKKFIRSFDDLQASIREEVAEERAEYRTYLRRSKAAKNRQNRDEDLIAKLKKLAS